MEELHMFKYWKEMRDLKRTERQLKVILLGKIYDVVQLLDSGSDIMELANKLKDVDQKEIVEKLVDAIKVNEKSK